MEEKNDKEFERMLQPDEEWGEIPNPSLLEENEWDKFDKEHRLSQGKPIPDETQRELNFRTFLLGLLLFSIPFLFHAISPSTYPKSSYARGKLSGLFYFLGIVLVIFGSQLSDSGENQSGEAIKKNKRRVFFTKVIGKIIILLGIVEFLSGCYFSNSGIFR